MDDMIVDDPYTLFQAWFDDAQRSEPSYPDAMTVTTVGADGMPSTRVLLLKGLDRRGFVFYTNQRSRKGRQLEANPHCALCFFRSEEHTSELQSLMRISYAVFCLNKKNRI